nr:dihydroxyacetone kinase 2-like isoform X2 [Halyomorpha halys]
MKYNKGKNEKSSYMEDQLSVTDEKSLLYSAIKAFSTSSHQNFLSVYKKRALLQLSTPCFPADLPVLRADIPDPSTRNIKLCDIGKNMDDAFFGFSMATPKVSCVARDKIIFREEFQRMTDRVRIISSTVGLCGNFVGRGMLTCMILGTYGSPKPRVIYNAIRKLNKTADRGILAIIPNNYDDKINWGLAIARAHRKGIIMNSILFGDNAYEDYKEDERSCLAGIAICYKLAGAMSEEKCTLPVITDRLNSMFFATISCHFGKKFHFGTDLNGRMGFEMENASKSEVMKEVFSTLLDPRRKYSVGYDPGTELVVLINTYLADSSLAQTVSVEMVTRFNNNGYVCSRIYAGNLVSSVAAGFSVTILPEGGGDILRWLDRYTSCTGWLVAGNGYVRKYRLSMPPPLSESRGICFNASQANMVRIAVECAVTNFTNSENYLNTNDPKGEYGTTMCNIGNFLLECLKENPLFSQYPYMLFTKIGECFESYFKNVDGLMFSLFAVTLGQYFGDHLRAPHRINERTWERALRRSVKSVAGYFKIGYKEHTLLDIFGSLYLIMSASRLDVLTDIHLALEVGDEQCWKVKYAKPNKIIEYPYLCMKSCYMMLDAIATMLRGTNKRQLAPEDIDTTPTITATKIKEILTAV